MKIFATELIRSNLIVPSEINYKNAIKDMFDSIYFTKLPEGLHAVTLFNKSIIINNLGSEAQNVSTHVYWGYILINLFHGSPHYFQRYTLSKDIEWLEHSTPTISKEAGSDLENNIFGQFIQNITLKAAKFILNPSNWEKNIAKFRFEFDRLNTNNSDKKNKIDFNNIRLKNS